MKLGDTLIGRAAKADLGDERKMFVASIFTFGRPYRPVWPIT